MELKTTHVIIDDDGKTPVLLSSDRKYWINEDGTAIAYYNREGDKFTIRPVFAARQW